MDKSLTNDERAELAELRKLKDKVSKGSMAVGGLKVAPKGGISLYGLGRFPITLYSKQWTKLFEQKDAIMEFIAMNKDALSTGKDDPRFKTVKKA